MAADNSYLMFDLAYITHAPVFSLTSTGLSATWLFPYIFPDAMGF
jgi:hypothetical protein